MKWREPWRESMKAQAPFNPFGKVVILGFLGWLALFLALFLVLLVTGRAAVSPQHLLGMAMLAALCLA